MFSSQDTSSLSLHLCQPLSISSGPSIALSHQEITCQGLERKKGKAWKTEFHIQRRAATLINTFASASNPSFSSFHSLLSSAFTPTLSFSLKLLNGWKESKVWPLWRTGCDVFRDVRPTFCTFMKFQQFDLVQFRKKIVNKSHFELSLHFTIVQDEL